MRVTTYEPGTPIVESAHTATADGLTTTTEAARSGSSAGVALLRAGDPEWKGSQGHRSEWHGVDGAALGVERWHGISYYLPADWYQGTNDSFGTRIVFQFHRAGSDPGWSPIYGLEIRGGPTNAVWNFYRKDQRVNADGSVSSSNVTLWSTPVVVGEWIDFVIHAKWTVDDQGFIELYRDGAQGFGAHGLVTMPSTLALNGPYSKWGIYGQPTRIFFDDVRIAEGPGQLATVSP